MAIGKLDRKLKLIEVAIVNVKCWSDELHFISVI